MIRSTLHSLCAGDPLDPARLGSCFDEVLDGTAPPELVAGLLVALRARPLSGEVLAQLAEVVRRRSRRVKCAARPLIDTCGTGGDGAGTFNISTAAAFVVAAAGGVVAKHGNRGVSSPTGSADVLEALDLPLDLEPDAAAHVLDSSGFAFLYAPAYHPSFARVQPVRRALGIPTLFNLVGPLVNPARPSFQVVGVARAEHARPMAEALGLLGVEGALVVHCDGLDELGLHAPTSGFRVRRGELDAFELDPRELGLQPAPVAALAGGTASENAARMRGVFAGESGPLADAVVLNAAAACTVAGLCESVADGVQRARELLDSGAVERVLQRTVESARRVAAGGVR